jgi:hypothetical protein
MNNVTGTVAAPGTNDIINATTTAPIIPVHIRGTLSTDTNGANTGHAPGAFNQIIFSLSNGTRTH